MLLKKACSKIARLPKLFHYTCKCACFFLLKPVSRKSHHIHKLCKSQHVILKDCREGSCGRGAFLCCQVTGHRECLPHTGQRGLCLASFSFLLSNVNMQIISHMTKGLVQYFHPVLVCVRKTWTESVWLNRKLMCTGEHPHQTPSARIPGATCKCRRQAPFLQTTWPQHVRDDGDKVSNVSRVCN